MKKLGFGLMRLPLTDKNNWESVDLKRVNEMVDYYMSSGFTLFDTAYPYHNGKSEAAARRAIVERFPRESFLLADKMPTWLVKSGKDYRRFFSEQLERCGVSYFDYYLLHTLGEKSYADTLKHGGFEFMRKVKAEGKAKRIGFSYHDKAELLDKILTEHPEMECVLLQINYADWENETIESRKCYETATNHGVPVITMEPVKGGSLANVPEEVDSLFNACRPGMSAASWAVRFAASLDNVAAVLSGMSSMEQLTDNVSYMRDFTPLSGEEKAVVMKAADIINAGAEIPCTACRYCLDECPKNIAIPEYFALYNNLRRFRFVPSHANYYANLAQRSGRASECTDCGQCTERCPQHIDIAEQMKKVSEIFDAKR